MQTGFTETRLPETIDYIKELSSRAMDAFEAEIYLNSDEVYRKLFGMIYSHGLGYKEKLINRVIGEAVVRIRNAEPDKTYTYVYFWGHKGSARKGMLTGLLWQEKEQYDVLVNNMISPMDIEYDNNGNEREDSRYNELTSYDPEEELQENISDARDEILREIVKEYTQRILTDHPFFKQEKRGKVLTYHKAGKTIPQINQALKLKVSSKNISDWNKKLQEILADEQANIQDDIEERLEELFGDNYF